MHIFYMFTHINQICLFLVIVNIFHVGASLTCLSCKDSPIPRDCQYTTICGQHEVCFTSSYITTVGSVRHELGCMDVSQCPTVSNSKVARSGDNLLVCSECCNGTLCNSGMCGQAGIPPLTAGSRGPICYACDQQLTPDTCHIIKECGRDEVCSESLQRYQSGQISGRLLIGKRGVKKRRNEQCTYKCCNTDLCNSDCSGSRVAYTAVKNITPPTTSPATPPTTPVVQTTPTPDTCTDQRNDCYALQQYCNMDWGLINCRKTCGLCSVALTDPCIDRTICSQNLQQCHTDWGRQYCIRSCNRCAELSSDQNQKQQDGSCQTPDDWTASECEQNRSYCNDPNNLIKVVCRHYCGYCPN